MSEQLQRHIRVAKGAMPRYCLIPGDPARAERIATRFARAEEVIRNREFVGFRGGGAARGRQPAIPVGSLVVVTAAHRGEGTSQAYLPPEFPAVADLDVTTALIAAARDGGQPPVVGICTTRDAFYQRDGQLAELLSTVGGVVAAEQEAAVVFIVAAVRRVRAGTVLAVDSNIFLPKKEPEEVQRLFREAEARAIDVALRAVERLAAADRLAAAGREAPGPTAAA